MNKRPEIQEFLFSFIMTEAAFLLLIVDGSGKIIQANRAAETLIGTELEGLSFEKILVDFQGNLKPEEILIPRDTPLLLNVMNKEGLPLTYYFRFKPFGESVIAIGQQDAGEIDEMRRNLISLNSELNNVTRDLHKKNAQLELLSKQKNQFFGMASHDLRHPLGVINMYSQFLEMEAAKTLSEEHQKFVKHIRDAGKLMESILNDFLDFAVFESGRFDLHCRGENLGDLLSRIAGYFNQLASTKSVKVIYSPPADEIQLVIDSAKIEQVINNLLSNALKYSLRGGAIQLILTRREAEVQIVVKDQGVGISPENISRIFQPYERIDSLANEEKSSGLGLAIVKKIVDAHGGQIWAESDVGCGATFTISLPATTPQGTEKK